MARIAVIGGGLGGLSAAIHLATRGHRVVLLEKNVTLGGKAGRLERDGFLFDTGPSLVTMPEALDELFAAAGRSRAQALPLVRLETQCRYFFADGASLDVHDDQARTAEAIDAIAPGEGQRFLALLALAARLHDVAGRPYLERPYEGFPSLGLQIGTRGISLLPLLARGTLGDLARDTVRDPRLRQLVGRFATYAGGAPDRSPAALAMVLHVEHAGGAWYPPGGIASIPRALEQLARDVGVEIRTNAPVSEIATNGGRVVGVHAPELERFDAVVTNADPVATARHLLPAPVARAAGLAQLERAELGLSGVLLLLGIRGRLPQFAHHNVMFPADSAREFADVFDRHIVPEDPVVYVSVASRTDPSRAPADDECVTCLVNAPATGGNGDFRAQRASLVERIVSRLERLVPDLRSRIVVEELIDPDQYAERYAAPGGSIYGISPHARFSPFHRPLARVEKLAGLYFAGGGTHPGGGIPLVVRSGRFAADLLEADLARGRIGARPELSA